MKMRLKSFFVAILAVVSLMPMFALAAPNIGLGEDGMATDLASKSGYEQVDNTSLSRSVGKVIGVLLSMVGTVFLALTVYAGILWMTASGNEEQVTKAQGIVKAATLGLIIVLAAYGITTFVVAQLTFAASPVPKNVGGNAGENFVQNQGSYWANWANNWKISTKSMLGID